MVVCMERLFLTTIITSELPAIPRITTTKYAGNSARSVDREYVFSVVPDELFIFLQWSVLRVWYKVVLLVLFPCLLFTTKS